MKDLHRPNYRIISPEVILSNHPGCYTTVSVVVGIALAITGMSSPAGWVAFALVFVVLIWYRYVHARLGKLRMALRPEGTHAMAATLRSANGNGLPGFVTSVGMRFEVIHMRDVPAYDGETTTRHDQLFVSSVSSLDPRQTGLRMAFDLPPAGTPLPTSTKQGEGGVGWFVFVTFKIQGFPFPLRYDGKLNAVIIPD